MLKAFIEKRSKVQNAALEKLEVTQDIEDESIKALLDDSEV